MIEIRPLWEVTADEIRALETGYASPARYVVRRDESPGRTTITLELVPLTEPFVKRWHASDDDMRVTRKALEQGLSFGAYEGEQLVGMAIGSARDWHRDLRVWHIGVAESQRRQGIGRLLIERLAEAARAAGLRAVVCETQSTNAPAIAFYRATGFELEGLDLSYYTNDDLSAGEVAILMKLKLPKG